MLGKKRSWHETKRCTSIKKNFCRNIINWEITHYHISRFLRLSCIHHVHLCRLWIMLHHCIAGRSDRRRRRKTPLVEALVSIVTFLLTFVASHLWEWTVIRSIGLWSLILRLVLITRVGRVWRTMATFVLLLVRQTKRRRRRRQPELLLLSCHKWGRRRLNCVSDSS